MKSLNEYANFRSYLHQIINFRWGGGVVRPQLGLKKKKRGKNYFEICSDLRLSTGICKSLILYRISRQLCFCRISMLFMWGSGISPIYV